MSIISLAAYSADPRRRQRSSRPRRLPRGPQASGRQAERGERGPCALGWGVAAFHHCRLGELGAKIAVRSELTEKGFAERLRVFLCFGVRPLDLRGAAFDAVTGQFHRRLGGKAEGDEEGWIVDVDPNLLAMRIKWLLERQPQVEREQALVVVERIVLGRLQRKIVAIPDMERM